MAVQLEIWIQELGEAAARMSQIGGLEGAAGNMSLFLPADTPDLVGYISSVYSECDELDLPGSDTLPPGTLLITGTGRRLREIGSRPEAVLCAIVIADDGRTVLHLAPGHHVRPTSEIDSHVGIHADILAGRPAIHAIIHAQPPSLTWLSHIPAYRDQDRLNRQLLRWQPETIVMLPDGIGVMPFEVPGTPKHGAPTVSAMRHHRLVVWAKHGVVARSTAGPLAAADLIDYAETAATYEVKDILAGRIADGMTLAEIRAVATRFAVPTGLLDRLPQEPLER